MSGTKPTPGPWRVIGSSVYAGRTPVAECRLGIAGERGPSYDEQCANARAIAAVPELIKALQEFDEAFGEFHGEMHDHHSTAYRKAGDRLAKAIKQARAALAKALEPI
jgi:hypothetical protein